MLLGEYNIQYRQDGLGIVQDSPGMDSNICNNMSDVTILALALGHLDAS